MKKLTILAGENSAGKSSVIQALLMQYLVLGKKMSSINTLNVMGNNLGVALNLISPESVTGGFSIETTVDGVERILNYSVTITFFVGEGRDKKECNYSCTCGTALVIRK